MSDSVNTVTCVCTEFDSTQTKTKLASLDVIGNLLQDKSLT